MSLQASLNQVSTQVSIGCLLNNNPLHYRSLNGRASNNDGSCVDLVSILAHLRSSDGKEEGDRAEHKGHREQASKK